MALELLEVRLINEANTHLYNNAMLQSLTSFAGVYTSCQVENLQRIINVLDWKEFCYRDHIKQLTLQLFNPLQILQSYFI